MSLTKDVTSGSPGIPITKSNQGMEKKNLLDLTPSDTVFYVGGYPDSFTVSSKEIRTAMLLFCIILTSVAFY